jgi:hypothetical protein
MMSKLQRENDAQAAMLAFRTGLSAAMCEAWIEAPIAKSAEAIKAAWRNIAEADHGQGSRTAF